MTVQAVLKMIHCIGLDFSLLCKKLDKLKEKAGFKLLPCPLPLDNPSIAESIWNWVNDQTPTLQPTWTNFLDILREPSMDMSDLADQIETCLTPLEDAMELTSADKSEGIIIIATIVDSIESGTVLQSNRVDFFKTLHAHLF